MYKCLQKNIFLYILISIILILSLIIYFNIRFEFNDPKKDVKFDK